MKNAIVTGSSGLIGSAIVRYLDERGWHTTGVDNNMRERFFGPDGDTTFNAKRLLDESRSFELLDLDIRQRSEILALFRDLRPQLVVHCAAQPSHDLAARIPFDDFEVNAIGTLNLLEAARRFSVEAPFVFMSTNKVYGDAPNELDLVELETRFDFADPSLKNGINEQMRIDRSLHSLFGASKLAADVLVQEYGRYFSMPTVCLRGGCLTGSAHASAELHGFLAYIVKATLEGREYVIYGYGGKQVRDNIHAEDVCSAIYEFASSPSVGAVYNVGGQRQNSVSVVEAIARVEELSGARLRRRYVDEPRRGDHICYITDMSSFKADYPTWEPEFDLDRTFSDLIEAGRRQL